MAGKEKMGGDLSLSIYHCSLARYLPSTLCGSASFLRTMEWASFVSGYGIKGRGAEIFWEGVRAGLYPCAAMFGEEVVCVGGSPLGLEHLASTST